MKDKEKHIVSLIKKQKTRNQGFELMLSLYSERLYYAVRKIVMVHEDAHDVIQNVWIKVFQNLNRFQEKSSLYTWLYRIATNEALSFIDKEKRRYVREETFCQKWEERILNDPYFDDHTIETTLLRGLAVLTNKERLVFMLRYFDEMSFNEIADFVQGNVSTLKVQYHNAQKKIKNQIAKSEL